MSDDMVVKLQSMLNDALKLADDGVVITQIGTVAPGGQKPAVPYTIAVACGTGALNLRNLLQAGCDVDPRSPTQRGGGG